MKFKVPYGIKKSLVKVLPFMATAIMATSCHKEPYDVVIDWDWVNPPDKELIRQYANDKNTQKIILNLRPYNSTSYTPAIFHRIYDSLYMNCFSIDPAKITGEGNIYVDEFNGAHLPDPYADDITGMAEIDSGKYKQIGFNIERGFPISR